MQPMGLSSRMLKGPSVRDSSPVRFPCESVGQFANSTPAEFTGDSVGSNGAGTSQLRSLGRIHKFMEA